MKKIFLILMVFFSCNNSRDKINEDYSPLKDSVLQRIYREVDSLVKTPNLKDSIYIIGKDTIMAYQGMFHWK